MSSCPGLFFVAVVNGAQPSARSLPLLTVQLLVRAHCNSTPAPEAQPRLLSSSCAGRVCTLSADAAMLACSRLPKLAASGLLARLCGPCRPALFRLCASHAEHAGTPTSTQQVAAQPTQVASQQQPMQQMSARRAWRRYQQEHPEVITTSKQRNARPRRMAMPATVPGSTQPPVVRETKASAAAAKAAAEAAARLIPPPLFDRFILNPVTLTLPGMAAGAAPASAEELLKAVTALKQKDQPVVLKDMQALVEHSTVAGPHRHFLIDTETSARLPNEYDPVQLCRIPWRVIELCCVDLTTGDKFSTLVNHGGRIHTSSSRVSGLTKQQLAGAPTTSQASLALLLWLWQRCAAGPAGASQLVLAGHNVSFDVRALAFSLADAGLHYPQAGWLTFCSMQTAKKLLKRNTDARLDQLAPELGVAIKGTLHRAAADVQLMHDVLVALAAKFAPGHTLQDAMTNCFWIPNAFLATNIVKNARDKVLEGQAASQSSQVAPSL